uniref:Response regulator n=1 Tax=Desulfobacca acetoxidans TaxID=60893 RepID=A0A7V4G6F7_9BACT
MVRPEGPYRTTLGKMLKTRGLEVDTAGSGEEAMALLAGASYDVVVLDIRMPGMGGIEALRQIKEAQALVEVIMLSGHASLDVAMELLKLGAFDYVLKPCPVEELLAKIESAFEKKLEREKIAAEPGEGQR